MSTAAAVIAPENEAHLQRIVQSITEATIAKYRAGQVEHGGNLWQKPGMIAHAIAEATDQGVYLHTLAEQVGQCVETLTLAYKCGDWTAVADARDRLARMLESSDG